MGLSCASKRCIITLRSLLLACAVTQAALCGWLPAAEQSSGEQSSSEQSSSAQSSSAQSSSAQSSSAQADTEQAASAQADTEQSATEQPASEEAATEQASSEAEGLPTPGKISYQPNIQRILNEHCLECHGPKQAKADLRVDDRDTLLSYITPGDLESSSLWGDYLTTSDTEMRMPPIKYGKPLSELELAAIRVWIEDGADWPDTLQPISDAPAAIAVAQNAPAEVDLTNRGYVQKMWTFVGFFHPAVVHFPIGLLLVSSLFIALAFIKREAFEPAAFHCLWIGTAGAILASVAGWAFAEIRGYGDFWHTHWNTDLIARHRISGVAVTSYAVGLCVLAFFARRRISSDLRILWLLGAMGLAGMVSLVGHQGGELTYGEELFARAYEKAFGPAAPAAESSSPAVASPGLASPGLVNPSPTSASGGPSTSPGAAAPLAPVPAATTVPVSGARGESSN